MDPNETLRLILEARDFFLEAHANDNHEAAIEYAHAVVDGIDGLHAWLSLGGALPSDWRHAK